ncbi:MAG: sensor histidine kinase [Planctomycetota bacterium]
MRRISLRTTLILAAVLPLLLALGPAVFLAGRAALRDVRAQTLGSVERARNVFEAQIAAEGRALMMHAKEASHFPALAEAIARRDVAALVGIAREVETQFGEPAVFTDVDGDPLVGPSVSSSLIDAVRTGEMPVAPDSAGGALRLVALAPVHASDGRLVGAAGVYRPFDDAAAASFAALTRTQVSFVLSSGVVAAATGPELLPISGLDQPGDVELDGETFIASKATLGEAGYAVFYSSLDAALGPVLRSLRILAAGVLAALLFALALAGLAAGWAARPAQQLADAAAALADGDFERPIPRPRATELDRLAGAFTEMRDALSRQIGELEEVNRELVAKERRLREVQAELIQREKLAATGRIIAQLSHEINNPIANVRNCLEVLERRKAIDEANRSFLTMAVDEVERLARLTHQVLDLNRRRPGEIAADPLEVARETLALEQHTLSGQSIETRFIADDEVQSVAIAPDDLKQVLLNLVQNAEDAMPDGGSLELEIKQINSTVRVIVGDSGPGVPADVAARIFDPFFTTKSGARGVGLGLFVAEEIVRTHGGRIAVERRAESGASFVIDLPAFAGAGAEAAVEEGRV